MLERVHQGVGRQVETLHLYVPVAGDRIGRIQAQLVDQLDSRYRLQHRVQFAHLHGTPERPAVAVGTADEGMQVPVELGDGLRANPVRVRSRSAAQVRDDVTPR